MRPFRIFCVFGEEWEFLLYDKRKNMNAANYKRLGPFVRLSVYTLDLPGFIFSFSLLEEFNASRTFAFRRSRSIRESSFLSILYGQMNSSFLSECDPLWYHRKCGNNRTKWIQVNIQNDKSRKNVPRFLVRVCFSSIHVVMMLTISHSGGYKKLCTTLY